ncbi:hypothetical protein, partial [Burkholderia gladioli]|uniref:hypothetical protein n=1 Tax=Burkholderia gladioli TaxID=28095 RepID=UPI001ABB8755
SFVARLCFSGAVPSGLDQSSADQGCGCITRDRWKAKNRGKLNAELAGEAVFLLHPLDNSATVALSRANLEAFLRSIDHAPAWLALKARAAA